MPPLMLLRDLVRFPYLNFLCVQTLCCTRIANAKHASPKLIVAVHLVFGRAYQGSKICLCCNPNHYPALLKQLLQNAYNFQSPRS